MSRARLLVRAAGARDAAALAPLCGQLGYPATAAQVRARLKRILPSRDDAVFVADDRGGQVIGWVHIQIARLVVLEKEAEIVGLVVDAAQRGKGVGAKLVAAAEAWACAKGCRGVFLRSNVIRRAAHRFYRREGYARRKSQHVFQKGLVP